MASFLGIDGGGTRTTAWLADEHGNVLGRATAGPSNPLKVGFDACHREILRAAKAAIHDARRVARVPHAGPAGAALKGSASRLDAVVLGLAGTDRPPIHNKLEAWLRKAIPARKHLLTSDAAIALRAAIGDSPGIIVISGTGSIAFAQDERGTVLTEIPVAVAICLSDMPPRMHRRTAAWRGGKSRSSLRRVHSCSENN